MCVKPQDGRFQVILQNIFFLTVKCWRVSG